MTCKLIGTLKKFLNKTRNIINQPTIVMTTYETKATRLGIEMTKAQGLLLN